MHGFSKPLILASFVVMASVATVQDVRAQVPLPEADQARAALEAMIACRAIGSAPERLACFDQTSGAAASVAERSANPALGMREDFSPKAVARSGIPAVQDPKAQDDQEIETAEPPMASFGAEDLPQLRNERQASPQDALLEAAVASVEWTRTGRYVIELDNGQVWRQLSSDSRRLTLSEKNPEGTPVTIKKTALGGHRLSTVGSKRSIRVERIK